MEKVRELLEEARSQLDSIEFDTRVQRFQIAEPMNLIDQALALLPPVCKTCRGSKRIPINLTKAEDKISATIPCPVCKQKPEREFTKEAREYFGDFRNDIQYRARKTALEVCTRLEAANGAALYYQEVNDVLMEKQKELEAENKAKGEQHKRLLRLVKNCRELVFMIAGGPLDLAAAYGPDFEPPKDEDVRDMYIKLCKEIEKEGQALKETK